MLQAIGNVLDLPGSMVRDVLTLRNPLDQLLSPFSQDDRTSGQQMIEDYTGSPGHSMIGTLLEMGLDPMTYLGAGLATKGAKALGLGGKAKTAYQAAKGYGGKAASAFGSLDDARATLGAIPGQVRSGYQKAVNYLDNATRLPIQGPLPSPAGGSLGVGGRMGVLEMLLGAGNKAKDAAVAGGDAALQALYGMGGTAANSARLAGGLAAAGLPMGARGGADMDEMEERILPTTQPYGPQIPHGARFSLSGTNEMGHPMQLPDWAKRYRYSLGGTV